MNPSLKAFLEVVRALLVYAFHKVAPLTIMVAWGLFCLALILLGDAHERTFAGLIIVGFMLMEFKRKQDKR